MRDSTGIPINDLYMLHRTVAVIRKVLIAQPMKRSPSDLQPPTPPPNSLFVAPHGKNKLHNWITVRLYEKGIFHKCARVESVGFWERRAVHSRNGLPFTPGLRWRNGWAVTLGVTAQRLAERLGGVDPTVAVVRVRRV